MILIISAFHMTSWGNGKYVLVWWRVSVLQTLLSNMSPDFSIIYRYFPKYRCISLRSEIQLGLSGNPDWVIMSSYLKLLFPCACLIFIKEIIYFMLCQTWADNKWEMKNSYIIKLQLLFLLEVTNCLSKNLNMQLLSFNYRENWL